ncbi:MAG: UPF0158 family protein [Thermoanaerobaculia bacterium]
MDIEWEELQAAILSRDPERLHYLDRETGEVVSVSGSGEPDGAEGEDSDDAEDQERLRGEIENDPDRFVEIEPVPHSDRVEWMAAYAQTVGDPGLCAQLRRALEGHQPEREFDRLLRAQPEWRARWIGFHDARAQEVIDGWVEENDVESDTPPPWKLKPARRKPKKKRKLSQEQA